MANRVVTSCEIWVKVSKIGAVLGSGAYGSVTKVEYDGKPACLKEGKMLRHLPRFNREAQILSRLDGIGGAPVLYAVASDQPMIVMSLCTGKTLHELLEDNDTPFCMWLNILKGVVYEVCRIHSENVIHNDMKTDNVLFETGSEDLKVSVIDFGLASSPGPNSCFPTGTAARYKKCKHYAPELFFGDVSSTHSDTWALGDMIDKIMKGVDIDTELLKTADSLKTLVRAMKRREAIHRPSLLVVYEQLSCILDCCLHILNSPVESPLNYESDSSCSESESETGGEDDDDSVCSIVEPVSAMKRQRDSDDIDEVGNAKKLRADDSVCVID